MRARQSIFNIIKGNRRCFNNILSKNKIQRMKVKLLSVISDFGNGKNADRECTATKININRHQRLLIVCEIMPFLRLRILKTRPLKNSKNQNESNKLG